MCIFFARHIFLFAYLRILFLLLHKNILGRTRLCYGENEIFDECGTICPATCQGNRGIKECSPACVPGCFCKKGYLKDTTSAKCILPQHCPQ